MKQLTIIATDLPAPQLPDRASSARTSRSWSGTSPGRTPFLIFGLGIEVVTVLILLYFFRRRGWIGGPTS